MNEVPDVAETEWEFVPAPKAEVLSIEVLERRLKENPDDRETLLDLVGNLAGVYADCRAAEDLIRLREILALLPDDEAPIERAFVAYLDWRDLAAVEWVRRAVRAWAKRKSFPPPTSDFYHWWVVFFLGKTPKGLWRAMEEEFSRLWSDWPGIVTLQGLQREQEERFDEAADCYERAGEAGPFWPSALFRARLARGDGDPDRAIEYALRALKTAPAAADQSIIIEDLASWLVEQRRYNDAATWYRRWLLVDPEESLAVSGLGLCLERVGRYQDALEVYDQADGQDAGRDDFGKERIRLLMRLGRYKEAQVIVDRLRRDPEQVDWTVPIRRRLASMASDEFTEIEGPVKPTGRVRSEASSIDSGRLVQAVIVNLTFADSLYMVEERIDRNYFDDGIDGILDLDLLRQFDEIAGPFLWTGPRWLMAGDVMFFYLTKKADAILGRVLREAEESEAAEELRSVLQRYDESMEQYAGTIFAYGIIGGPPERVVGDPIRDHFASTVFLPLSSVHWFKTPLRASDCRDIIRINTGSTGAYLNESSFEALKHRLIAENGDVGPLEQLRFGDLNLSAAKSSKNWHSIVRNPDIRFLYEEQVSEYFVEPFLNELKDRGSGLCKECWCEPRDQNAPRGRADYFVRVSGSWIPVEVKFDLGLTERILDQIAKYTDLTAFISTQISRIGERIAPALEAPCLIIDRNGIYLAVGGRFVAGEPGRPGWSRLSLDEATSGQVRERIRAAPGSA